MMLVVVRKDQIHGSNNASGPARFACRGRDFPVTAILDSDSAEYFSDRSEPVWSAEIYYIHCLL